MAEMQFQEVFFKGSKELQLENIFDKYLDGYLDKLKLPNVDEHFADFLNKLCCYDENKRISVADALQHQYML